MDRELFEQILKEHGFDLVAWGEGDFDAYINVNVDGNDCAFECPGADSFDEWFEEFNRYLNWGETVGVHSFNRDKRIAEMFMNYWDDGYYDPLRQCEEDVEDLFDKMEELYEALSAYC